jgi:hypothetical protein
MSPAFLDLLVLTFSHVILLAEDVERSPHAVAVRALEYADAGVVTFLYIDPSLTLAEVVDGRESRRAIRGSRDHDLILQPFGTDTVQCPDGSRVPIRYVLDYLTSFEGHRIARLLPGTSPDDVPAPIASIPVHEGVGLALGASTLLPSRFARYSAYHELLESADIIRRDALEATTGWWEGTLTWPSDGRAEHVLAMREAGAGAQFMNEIERTVDPMKRPLAEVASVVSAQLTQRMEAARWLASTHATLAATGASAGLAAAGAISPSWIGRAISASAAAPPLVLELARRRASTSWTSYLSSTGQG